MSVLGNLLMNRRISDCLGRVKVLSVRLREFTSILCFVFVFRYDLFRNRIIWYNACKISKIWEHILIIFEVQVIELSILRLVSLKLLFLYTFSLYYTHLT
jgi:hypothetical protein